MRLANTGHRASRETVQVYLRPADPSQLVRLIGWTGVEVPAGEDATVDVACDPRPQRRWDPASHGWQPLVGGEVVIARGLGDVRLTARIPIGD